MDRHQLHHNQHERCTSPRPWQGQGCCELAAAVKAACLLVELGTLKEDTFVKTSLSQMRCCRTSCFAKTTESLCSFLLSSEETGSTTMHLAKAGAKCIIA